MEKLSEKLPKAFVLKIKQQLGKKYKDYEDAINQEAVRGLRVNTCKISTYDFLKLSDFELEKLEFAEDGFILKSSDKIGNTTYHLSGLCYLQEPSSMIAVASSEIEKEARDLKVLDLCASPGGKTGQIASRVSEKSLVFSNEINRSRAEVLHSNVERLGFKNVITLNEIPENLIKFESYFDYVFVDAPCSGEGMFRKNPETISQWSEANVEMCSNRQKEILSIAKKLVKNNGKLIYSTCTFSEAEDEEIVQFLTENGYKLIDVPESVKACTVGACKNGYARKFYPFSGKGEGQFVAVLEKTESQKDFEIHAKKHYKKFERIGKSDFLLVSSFMHENLSDDLNGKFYRAGSNVFVLPDSFTEKEQTILDEVRFLSAGVLFGSIEKARIEPNHNLFMAYCSDFKVKIELSDEEVKKYLHGEELQKNIKHRGYAVVTKNGFALGGVKVINGRLKNLYPKGLRI